MDKIPVDNFDQDVCTGDRADVGGPCRHLVPEGESTGRPVIDLIADLEGGPKCGACSCPLKNLALTGRVPPQCPRVAAHNRG